MNIDFSYLHKTYLVAQYVDNNWLYTKTNDRNPKKGVYPSSMQIFSNHALQVAIYLYNGVNAQGLTTSVHHCLYLNFSHKMDNQYLLNNDPDRIAFNLDIGTAKQLYCFAVGLTDAFQYTAIRTNKAPKKITSSVEYVNATRVVKLTAASAKGGELSKVTIELTESDLIGIAVYALGYGRLLYPALSDSALQSIYTSLATTLLVRNPPISNELMHVSAPSPDANEEPKTRACAENRPADEAKFNRLRKAIWAIGQQKWPGMKIEALKRIQNEQDSNLLQSLVDQANLGDFRSWDSYL